MGQRKTKADFIGILRQNGLLRDNDKPGFVIRGILNPYSSAASSEQIAAVPSGRSCATNLAAAAVLEYSTVERPCCSM